MALPILLASLAVVPANAADRFWVTPSGGTFGTAANWSATAGGAGGASVPAAADVASFTLNNTYTATFSSDATNLRMDVTNGAVTFDLNAKRYTLTGGAAAATIGSVIGQTGRLTVADGTLAVVTHGLVCRSLAARHLALPEGTLAPERWENTSVTIVDARAPWRVSLLNCIAHLDEPGAAPTRGSAAV